MAIDQLQDIASYVKRLCNKRLISFQPSLISYDSTANKVLEVGGESGWGMRTWRSSRKLESSCPL